MKRQWGVDSDAGFLWRRGFFFGEEVAEIFGTFGDVILGEVGVDFPHGAIVRPAADFHGDFFWNLKVIGKGGE